MIKNFGHFSTKIIIYFILYYYIRQIYQYIRILLKNNYANNL